MAATRNIVRKSGADHGIQLLLVLWFGQLVLHVGGQDTMLAHENDGTKTMKLCGHSNYETFTSVEVINNLKRIASDLENVNFSEHFQQFNQYIQQQIEQLMQQLLDRQRQQLKEDLSTAIRTKQSLNITEVPLIPAENCSYPFTLYGTLYHNCSAKFTHNTGTSGLFCCLMTNRSMTLCDPSSGFTASFSQTNLSVKGLPTVPVTSIFGWIIFQQRTLITSNFDWQRNWRDYKMGFGSIDSNFWLGLERLHLVTSSANYRLRIEMQANNTGSWYSAEYWLFKIGDESVSKFKLTVAGYAGDSGDALQYIGGDKIWYHNGMAFTTYDTDNDLNSYDNCARYQGGGWWFNFCYWGCLTCQVANMEWASIPDGSSFLKTSRMMIKRQ